MYVACLSPQTWECVVGFMEGPEIDILSMRVYSEVKVVKRQCSFRKRIWSPQMLQVPMKVSGTRRPLRWLKELSLDILGLVIVRPTYYQYRTLLSLSKLETSPHANSHIK